MLPFSRAWRPHLCTLSCLIVRQHAQPARNAQQAACTRLQTMDPTWHDCSGGVKWDLQFLQAKAAQDGKAGQVGPQYEQRIAEMQKQLDESSKT